MTKDKKDFRFDRRASEYDEGVEGKLSQRFYNLLLREVKLTPGVAVLDVGCGTGALLRKLARDVPISGYGIDVEPNMIVEAQKKCPDMVIQVSRSEATPFECGSFDVMTACMAYHHFADREGVEREAARLLKPGGRLYIADPKFPLVVRKAINGILRLFRVAGYFSASQEVSERFGRYGFACVGEAMDGFAQVVVLQRR